MDAIPLAKFYMLSPGSVPPLAFSVGYALSNGIARYSSCRYNLPADWVAYFYFGIGTIEIFTLVARLFGGGAAHIVRMETGNMKNEQLQPSALISALVFVFIGALPWLAEGMVAPQFADQSLARITQQAGVVSNAPNIAEIQAVRLPSQGILGSGSPALPKVFSAR